MLRFPVAAVTARAACVELRRLSNVENITSKQFTCKMQLHLSHSTTRWRLSIGSRQYEQLSSEEAAAAADADAAAAVVVWTEAAAAADADRDAAVVVWTEAAAAADADRDAVGEVGGGDDPERIQISSATASWMSEAT
jgi:hypothetical protein